MLVAKTKGRFAQNNKIGDGQQLNASYPVEYSSGYTLGSLKGEDWS